MKKILVINLGSTSTKLAIYEDSELKKEISIEHGEEELRKYNSVIDQKDFRKKAILDWLASEGEDLDTFDAIAPRGGLVHPIVSGTYLVNRDMIEDLSSCKYGSHVSNVAGIIGYELGLQAGIPALTTDPVVVDEFIPEARFSGNRVLERKSIFHALNQKASARLAAKILGKPYEECNLVVAHMGGGITVGAHCMGRVIDANNGADGDGPFSTDRAGGLPSGDLARLCFSGKYTEAEVLKMINGAGGMMSYVQENDMRKIEARIREGDQDAELVRNALAYQVAKTIGAYSIVSRGKIDAIVLTGGLAHSREFTELVGSYVKDIAPILVFPGENEGNALQLGALRVLNGEEAALTYTKVS